MQKNNTNFFEKLATKITSWTGSFTAFGIAAVIVVVWLITGPVFHYSDTWQLVINTGTTIITFLMVFLIQKTQNKDSKAIQLKLNELIASSQLASNRMVDIEDLSEDELEVLHKFYKILSEKAGSESNIHDSHSIDVAIRLHQKKSLQKRGNTQD